jgi:(2Fe-2S) ferredoxin
MLPYERHVFVCVNERPPDHRRGCCASRNGKEILAQLKLMNQKSGLAGRVRINAAGCLDECERGAAIVVYPEAVWYGQVTLDDVEELYDSHVVNGRPVERLRLAHSETRET